MVPFSENIPSQCVLLLSPTNLSPFSPLLRHTSPLEKVDHPLECTNPCEIAPLTTTSSHKFGDCDAQVISVLVTKLFPSRVTPLIEILSLTVAGLLSVPPIFNKYSPAEDAVIFVFWLPCPTMHISSSDVLISVAKYSLSKR